MTRAETLEDAFVSYLDHLGTYARPGTMRTALCHIAQMQLTLVWSGGDFTKDVADYIAVRRGQGRADATINAELRTLRAALNTGSAAARALGASVKLIREVKALPEILDDSQLRLLLDGEEHTGSGLACLIAAYAGLRAGEIAHLRVRDVDPELGAIRVTEDVASDWRPKSHAERSVPLHPRLREVLTHLTRHCSPESIIVGGSAQALSKTAVERFRRKRIQAAKPGLHCLRRTWASRLLRATGGDLETVRQLGGWSDIKTVQRYLGSTDKLKRQAIDSLD